jgi:hypothetical protein
MNPSVASSRTGEDEHGGAASDGLEVCDGPAEADLAVLLEGCNESPGRGSRGAGCAGRELTGRRLRCQRIAGGRLVA